MRKVRARQLRLVLRPGEATKRSKGRSRARARRAQQRPGAERTADVTSETTSTVASKSGTSTANSTQSPRAMLPCSRQESHAAARSTAAVGATRSAGAKLSVGGWRFIVYNEVECESQMGRFTEEYGERSINHASGGTLSHRDGRRCGGRAARRLCGTRCKPAADLRGLRGQRTAGRTVFAGRSSGRAAQRHARWLRRGRHRRPDEDRDQAQGRHRNAGDTAERRPPERRPGRRTRCARPDPRAPCRSRASTSR